jgi:Rrf2 family protein
LIQGRLIKATPGPHGGLRLNLQAEDITLLQIIETLEGPVCLSPCLDNEPCERQEGCLSNPVWNDLQEKLVDHLNTVRLSTLVEQPEPVALEKMAVAGANGKSV